MRAFVLLPLLLLAACDPALPPEQIAASRAAALVKGTGHGDGTVLAPIAGLDGAGQVGVCGLIETPAGPVRVVVNLAENTVKLGVPAAQGGNRLDIGESRFCSETARARWEQAKKVDPVGLVAKLG